MNEFTSGLPALALVVLSLVGAWNALYFSAVTHEWTTSAARFVPAFCRPDEGTCMRIVRTPYARVFGVPNSDVGLVYYALVIAWTVGSYAAGQPVLPWAFRLATLATVVVGAYLTWALRYRLRTACPLCLAGHAINLLIACIAWCAV